jgi:hypothetical protein
VKWRFTVLTLLLAAGHFLLLLFLLLLVWGTGMAEFEGEEAVLASDSVVFQALDVLCATLAYPVAGLWTPWMSQNMPSAVEQVLFCANSLLWGFAGAFVVRGAVRIASRGLRRTREQASAS